MCTQLRTAAAMFSAEPAKVPSDLAQRPSKISNFLAVESEFRLTTANGRHCIRYKNWSAQAAQCQAKDCRVDVESVDDDAEPSNG